MAQNFLEAVKIQKNNYSKFDLTHDVKMSSDMGWLYPCLVMEVVPGDRFKMSVEGLEKFMPLVAPVMDRLKTDYDFFFVPNRLVWPNWETWITNGGDNPNAVSNVLPAFPHITYGPSQKSILGTYMGLPDPATVPTATNDALVSAIPFASLAKIFDDYYRDENILDKVFKPLTDGNNDAQWAQMFKNLYKRAWQPDLFTKALPFAQKGLPVELPVANFQDVGVKVDQNDYAPGSAAIKSDEIPGGAPADIIVPVGFPSDPSAAGFGLYALTSTLSVDAVTINDLRTAFRLQEWLEKNARYGTRYTEMLRGHFNVIPEDARLQRPEFIGRISSPVIISETLNTTGTSSLPQGNMAGNATAVAASQTLYKTVKEHGYIICLKSTLPQTSYCQGIAKHWLKIDDPKQLLWPSFAHIGEQEVQNQEIYAYTATDKNAFGYQPNYYEYRYMPNAIRGAMATTLKFWHLGRLFDTQPALNKDFINSDPTGRIFAVTPGNHESIVSHILFKIHALRQLPKFGTPTF